MKRDVYFISSETDHMKGLIETCQTSRLLRPICIHPDPDSMLDSDYKKLTGSLTYYPKSIEDLERFILKRMAENQVFVFDLISEKIPGYSEMVKSLLLTIDKLEMEGQIVILATPEDKSGDIDVKTIYQTYFKPWDDQGIEPTITVKFKSYKQAGECITEFLDD